jgi:hypothetical protein
MGVIKRIELTQVERAELERIVAAASSEVRMVERARIVLCASEGLKGTEIAERVRCSLPRVVKWRGRYACDGIEGVARRAASRAAAHARSRGQGAVDRQGVHAAARDV